MLALAREVFAAVVSSGDGTAALLTSLVDEVRRLRDDVASERMVSREILEHLRIVTGEQLDVEVDG